MGSEMCIRDRVNVIEASTITEHCRISANTFGSVRSSGESLINRCGIGEGISCSSGILWLMESVYGFPLNGFRLVQSHFTPFFPRQELNGSFITLGALVSQSSSVSHGPLTNGRLSAATNVAITADILREQFGPAVMFLMLQFVNLPKPFT